MSAPARKLNAPARKLNLEELLRKWYEVKKIAQGIEQTMEKFLEEQQDRLNDACRDLGIVEDAIDRAGECHGETLVYTLDDVTMVLVWEGGKYTVNLVKVREL